MKKLLILFGVAALSAAQLQAVERTVDTRLIPSPRSAFYLQNDEDRKTISAGRDLRDRDLLPGMVILDNGKLGESDLNFVYEIPISNLKGIQFRAVTSSSSLAWATYDANGNVCRLGPVAQVEKSDDDAPQPMPEYKITFLPQEKSFCYCVGKATRGKVQIRYLLSGAEQAEK